MPLAGASDVARREAHVRWAARYARQKNIPKALAHFGRAMEFGTTGPVYITIAIYIPRAEADMARASYRSQDSVDVPPLLKQAMSPLQDDGSDKSINTTEKNIARELLKRRVREQHPDRTDRDL